jgi:methyl-accepting chemotaxis protein
MKNLKIGTRLAAGFGLVLALMILMTAIGIRHMGTVADATRDMMQQPLAKERMISDWYRLIHTSVRRTSAISKSSDPSLGPFFAEETARPPPRSTACRRRSSRCWKAMRKKPSSAA